MYANSIDAVAGMSSTINGESCTEVQVNFEGTKSMLCIADDGRVLSQTYRDQNPVTQAPGTIVEFYSDYREVQGLSIPFARSITCEGAPLAEMNVEAFEVNPNLDAALFER